MKRLTRVLLLFVILLIPVCVKAKNVVTVYVFYDTQNTQYNNLIDMLNEIESDPSFGSIFEYKTYDLNEDLKLKYHILDEFYYIDYKNFFYTIGGSYQADFVDDKESSTYYTKKEMLKSLISYYSSHDYVDLAKRMFENYDNDDTTYVTNKPKTTTSSSSDSIDENNPIVKFIKRLVKDRTYRLVVMAIFFGLIILKKLGETVKKNR